MRDTTRIAASAPELWVQILGANSAPVVDVLDALSDDLRAVADALRAPEAPGARRAVADTIRRGNDGVERLPGKHGQNRRYESLVVMVDDTPGQLGRLFGELGELGVNVEDLRLEHSPGAQFGLAEISVDPTILRHARVRPDGARLEDREPALMTVTIAIDGPAGSGKSQRVEAGGRAPSATATSTPAPPTEPSHGTCWRGAPVPHPTRRTRRSWWPRHPTSPTPSRSTPTTTGCGWGRPTSPPRSASRG